MALKQYKVAILGSGSGAGEDGDAYTYIRAKGICQRVEISECPPDGFTGAFVRLGLNYILGPQWDPNWGTPAANVQGLPAEIGATILLNDQIEEGNAGGRVIGHGAVRAPGEVNYNPATVLCKIKSATAAATAVLVKEYS